MTRPEKRQEKRAQEQALRMKELEAKGFNFVGSEEYQGKRAIANRKCCHETPDVFKEGSMKDAWREAMGLIRLTPENILKRHCGGRNQVYRWINDVEYIYGTNGRLKEQLHVVVCEETWEETSRTTGKMTAKSTRYVWISGKEITKTNVETRCLKIGRYRWKIENNFLVMKHQGYHYEHCFSYNWNAMVGFHHLMQIGRFINVLLAHSELLEKKVTY